MPEITVTSQTLRRLQEIARSRGLASVRDYLEELASAPKDDGFVFTPEVKAALDEGMDDIRNGRVVTMTEAMRSLDDFKNQWRANHAV